MARTSRLARPVKPGRWRGWSSFRGAPCVIAGTYRMELRGEMFVLIAFTAVLWLWASRAPRRMLLSAALVFVAANLPRRPSRHGARRGARARSLGFANHREHHFR